MGEGKGVEVEVALLLDLVQLARSWRLGAGDGREDALQSRPARRCRWESR